MALISDLHPVEPADLFRRHRDFERPGDVDEAWAGFWQ